jgi:hypothetical protein
MQQEMVRAVSSTLARGVWNYSTVRPLEVAVAERIWAWNKRGEINNNRAKRTARSGRVAVAEFAKIRFVSKFLNSCEFRYGFAVRNPR